MGSGRGGGGGDPGKQAVVGLQKAGEKRAGGGSSEQGIEGEKGEKMFKISQLEKLEKNWGWSWDSTEDAGGALSCF